jgi:hypothetical protein
LGLPGFIDKVFCSHQDLGLGVPLSLREKVTVDVVQIKVDEHLLDFGAISARCEGPLFVIV